MFLFGGHAYFRNNAYSFNGVTALVFYYFRAMLIFEKVLIIAQVRYSLPFFIASGGLESFAAMDNERRSCSRCKAS